ncbi:hypothetical protein GCM10008022_44740 [Paenibacillus hunanensis]|nr:hypothetical protein GCM10008022_44740 [Paenibacillus hunanensis]
MNETIMTDGGQTQYRSYGNRHSFLIRQRNKRRADNDGGIEQSGCRATIFDFGCDRISDPAATDYCNRTGREAS